MAVVDSRITRGAPITLGAADEFTHWMSPGDASGLVTMHLNYGASWSGTLTFQAGMKQIDSEGAITILVTTIEATDLSSSAVAITTDTGTDKTIRIDCAGGLFGVRVYCSVWAVDEVVITPSGAMG